MSHQRVATGGTLLHSVLDVAAHVENNPNAEQM
jgi:hypothetical protein